jgi:hypothetical protein
MISSQPWKCSRLACCLVGCLVCSITVLAGKDADPRLSSVRRAWIEPIDEIGDDKPIVACLAQNINKTTPIEAVRTKAEADVIMRVGSTSKQTTITVCLPDGTTKLWSEEVGQKAGFGLIEVKLDVCGQADRLLDALQQAMKKAREKSK